MTTFLAPSSYGEALDRLTILQLKLDYIQDKRREDVQVEFNDLFELVKDLIQKDKFHYEKLLEVNRIMWNIQDKLHEGKTQNKEEEYILMKQLAVENQRRFRLKRTINQNLGSKHREQKGYKGKRAFILSHLGMGDHFFMNGAIRYLATYFDEVCVVVKHQYEKNLQQLFKDEPSVSFFIVDTDKDISPAFGCPFETFQKAISGFDFVGLCGYHKGSDVNNFPKNFYTDLEIPEEIMFRWASFSCDSKVLPNEPFCFYHNISSNQTLSIPVDTEEQLIINPVNNMYPIGHKWHFVAQNWVGLPILDYVELLKHSSQIKMVDSSFFCMAILMGLKPQVWCRNGRSYKNIVPELNEQVVNLKN